MATKSELIRVRLTGIERQLLEERAAQHAMSLSEYVRMLLRWEVTAPQRPDGPTVSFPKTDQSIFADAQPRDIPTRTLPEKRFKPDFK